MYTVVKSDTFITHGSKVIDVCPVLVKFEKEFLRGHLAGVRYFGKIRFATRSAALDWIRAVWNKRQADNSVVVFATIA